MAIFYKTKRIVIMTHIRTQLYDEFRSSTEYIPQTEEVIMKRPKKFRNFNKRDLETGNRSEKKAMGQADNIDIRTHRRHAVHRDSGHTKDTNEESDQQKIVCCPYSIIHKPQWIELRRPVASKTENYFYSVIRDDFEKYSNYNDINGVFKYVKEKKEKTRIDGNLDDMAVMRLVHEYDAVQYLTGDLDRIISQCKELIKQQNKLDLKYKGIVLSVVYNNLFFYYMYQNKTGKAHSSMEAAVDCIRDYSPSSWTSRVYEVKGNMYDGLAHRWPNSRRNHQEVAIECYRRANEHHLYHSNKEEDDFLFYRMHYALHMIHLKLNMPTLITIRDNSNDIVYQRLIDIEQNISKEDIKEAQTIHSWVKSEVNKLTHKTKKNVEERLLISHIIIYIRLCQLELDHSDHKIKKGHNRDYTLAKQYIDTGLELYTEWSQYPEGSDKSKFKVYPHLSRDLKQVLDKIYNNLLIRIEASTALHKQGEYTSTSLSSESEYIPPSILEYITDNIRRVDKKTDAYEYCFSSEDISSGSGDLSSDLA